MAKLARRELVVIGAALTFLLIVGGWLVATNRPTVDPGNIEVSALEDDRLYEGTANEYEDERRRTKKAKPYRPEDLKPIAPLPQHPLIQVYFNQSRAQTYTDPYRNIERYGDNLEQVVIDEINQATSSLDVAVHELNLPGIAQAIAQKHQAGIKVRLIMENTYTQDAGLFTPSDLQKLKEHFRSRAEGLLLYMDINHDGKLTPDELAQRDAIYIFNTAHVPWIDDTEDGSKGGGIMHNKYILIDGKTLITGSTNLTFSDVHGDYDVTETRGNYNNLLVLRSPALVTVYQQDFDGMWGDGPGGQKDSRFGTKKTQRRAQTTQVGDVAITVQFSPAPTKIPFEQTTNGLIIQELRQARRSLHMALFVFSAQEIVDALFALKQGNTTVDIAGVFDPGFSYRDFSETLDLWGITLPSRTCTIEALNTPWNPPLTTIGVPRLAEGDKMHHKYAVIDSTTIITGSHNWSPAANNTNDENTLIIRSPLIAAHYEREFERMYTKSFRGPSKKLRQKVADTTKRCPTVTQKAPPKSAKTTPTPSSPSVAPPSTAPININTADAQTLDQLPGISPSAAQAIVEFRQTNGAFSSLQDLDAVKGIGPKILEKIQGRVIF